MGFQTPQLPLKDLLGQVSDGRLQLPDFQREYKWDDERIRSLLATLTLGHPMGVLMMLETGGTETRFKPRPLAGVTRAQDAPDHLLLDGQQRMTSLFQALKSGAPVDTKDARGKIIQRWYYLDISESLGAPAVRDEAVKSVPDDRVFRSDFGRQVDLDLSTDQAAQTAGMFPLYLAFDGAAATSWLFSFAQPGGVLDPARFDLFQRFQTEVLDPMRAYVIPSIQLGRNTSKEAVCTVFEKVNTGGLPLDVFELLTATFAGDPAHYARHGTDFRLNDYWAGVASRLKRHAALTGVRSTDLLQAVALLATRSRRLAAQKAGTSPTPAISARRADILRLELAEFLEWSPKVEEGLIWAADFLADQHVFVDSDIPYRTQLVPLAALRAVMGRDIDQHAVARRIRRWYWCGVLGEQYGSTVETKFARDVEQVPDWARGTPGANEPETITRAGFRESRLLSLKSRRSSAYKGIHALLMTQTVKDWKFNQNIDQSSFNRMRIDIHHIFPYDWCNKKKVDPNQRDCIVNKTPLSYDTNRSIGGNAPSRYLRKLEKSGHLSPDELDVIVAQHLIDTAALRRDDFETFFSERMQRLVKIIGDAMGTDVVLDVTESGRRDAADSDLPEMFEPEQDDTRDENGVGLHSEPDGG